MQGTFQIAKGVVEVHIKNLGETPPLGFGHEPCDLVAANRAANILSKPRTDAEEIRPVGGVGGVEELPLQSGQGFTFLADQGTVHEVQQMVALRLGQGKVQ